MKRVKNTKRKLISFFGALCLICALFPLASYAADAAIARAYTENGNTSAELENIGSGTLIAVKYSDGALQALKTAEAKNGTVTIEGIEADKVLLWDSLKGMKPLCAAKPVQNQTNPTQTPTQNPTTTPTVTPTQNPTQAPTTTPTQNPTTTPTITPTQNPTTTPTVTPTQNPTATPTVTPTQNPTTTPTITPTQNPTTTPTVTPTQNPTATPTVTPTQNPTTTPTITPTREPLPTFEPDTNTDPDNLPKNKAWTVNDSELNAIVTAAADKVPFGPYDGLSGYGDWVNANNGEFTYTHNGKTYTFANGKCWRAGGGNDTRRNFHFKPEDECTVTVAYSTSSADRPLYICQGSTAEENRLATGTQNYADGKTAVLKAEITKQGEVYIVGGSSNKFVYGIFVDYKKAKLSGSITHNGGTSTAGAKIVFTDASDADNKYETPFGASYAIAVKTGKTYNISIIGADGAEIADLKPIPSSITVNGETKCDIDIADLNTQQVTGDVVVHEYTPNDGTTLDLSGVKLKFTDNTDNTVYTVDKIENNSYSVLLKPGRTYTVTAENAEGYTLSELSGEYVMPSGETGCFKNILLTENLEPTEFSSTIKVGEGEKYERVNDAIAAIKKMTNRPEGEQGRVTVTLDSGVYQEQVTVDTDYVTFEAANPSDKPKITFYYGIGYRYYSSNGESGDDTAHAAGGYYDEDLAVQKTRKGNVDRWGPVVHVTGNYFQAENIIFVNSFNCKVVQAELDDGVEPSTYSDVTGKPDRTVPNYDVMTKGDSQVKGAVERAAAMAADGSYYEFNGCEFISSQDTLFTNNIGYFKDCYIEGGTDYIFGGNSVIFDGCTLAWHGYSDKLSGGYITACRTAAQPTAGTPNLETNGYLLRNCTVIKSKYYSGNKFDKGGWGRNWGGKNCQVVFDNITIASGTDVPGKWNAMNKASENAPFSDSILFVGSVKKDGGSTAVDTSGTDFNPNGTMADNSYNIMSDESYLGDWTPKYK